MLYLRLFPVIFLLVSGVGPFAAQAQQLKIDLPNPILENLDGVSTASLQNLIIATPSVGWYYLARGDSTKYLSKIEKYSEWRDEILEAVKTEIARSELALETPESQLRRMQKNDNYSSPQVWPQVEVYEGWYRVRLRLQQNVELPNGQYVGDAVTYETQASTGKLGSEPKEKIVEAVREEVGEFLRDWRDENE